MVTAFFIGIALLAVGIIAAFVNMLLLFTADSFEDATGRVVVHFVAALLVAAGGLTAGISGVMWIVETLAAS